MKTRSICGVIIASTNPQRLAEFYGDVLGLAFAIEEHGDLAVHYGADIGTVHFGIHPLSNVKKSRAGNSATLVAFNVESLELCMGKLKKRNAEQVMPPHDEGFGVTATYLDPEGNQLELVELHYDFGAEKSTV